MPHSTRLLIVIDELDIGGTEQQILELVKRLDRTKYTPMVCCFRPGRVSAEIESAGVQVFHLRKRAKFDVGLLFSLLRLMRRERIELVQTYLFTANTWARLAAVLAGVPLIVTSERNVDMWEEGYKKVLGRWLDRWTALTIGNSAAVKDYLVDKGIAADKLQVVYNGVDPRRFQQPTTVEETKESLGIPFHHAVVGMLARLEPQKDPATFIQAAALVSQKIADVSFLIIGGGSLKSQLEQQVQQLGLSDRVVFAGPRRDVPQLLAICDVSALSSLKEGMSNTIMETMAAGKPMVATNVGGNPELIVDAETGFIVPTRDPGALADKLVRMLSDRDVAAQMGRRAKARIMEKFSVQSLVKKTEQIYDSLVYDSLVNETLPPRPQHQTARLAFIVSQFPRYVDAYFLREVKTLAERGLDFKIFSLLDFTGKNIHKDAEVLLPRTAYSPLSWNLFKANMRFLLGQPGDYCGLLGTIIRGCWKSPRELIRNLAIFPKAVSFAAMVEDQGISHVHANWATHPTTAAMVIARLTGAGWSFTGHASDIFLHKSMLKEKVQSAQFVATCTRHNKDYLVDLAGPDTAEKIIVSYHGVDLEKFIPQPKPQDDLLRILSVGTLNPCKGLPDLIAACRILAERGITFTCTIAGDGPDRKALEQQIHQSGLADLVNILGYVPQEELVPLYQQASVVALPALSESHFGIPNILLEALAVKTPVISTPLESLSEVIEDGTHGLYVPEHAPEALADALESLSQDPHRCRTIGSAGRRVIEDAFDTQKNIVVLERLFQNALQSSAEPGAASSVGIEQSPLPLTGNS